MRYELDPSQSRFTIQAFARGMLAGLGHNPTFAVRSYSGELRGDPAALAEASFHLEVTADSLTVTDPVSPKDRADIEGRMRQEVLETASYPKIAFHSTQMKADRIADNWYRLQIGGELRLHGVKKQQTIDVQARFSDDQVRLSGQFKLVQSSFRIKEVTALGGMIRLQDDLKCDFDLVAVKKDEAEGAAKAP